MYVNQVRNNEVKAKHIKWKGLLHMPQNYIYQWRMVGHVEEVKCSSSNWELDGFMKVHGLYCIGFSSNILN